MSHYGLGRGLDALIARKNSPSQNPIAPPSGADRDGAIEVPITLIDANTYQPRQNFKDTALNELAQSIRQYGIIQPLVVSRNGDRYRLIAGERRLRAATLAGLEQVPVVFRDAHEHEQLAVALIENIQRVDLNGVELALAYRRLIDEFNITQEELGKRVGKSRPVITNTLRFLNLPGEIQEAVRSGDITYTTARTILSIPDPAEQLRFFREQGNTITSEEVEMIVRDYSKKEFKPRYGDENTAHKESLLREYFGTRVEVKKKKNGAGAIVIEFFSDEELATIVNRIIQ